MSSSLNNETVLSQQAARLDQVADDNPRKRSRTACTRCKTRKQKCDSRWPVCSNCDKAGAECDMKEIKSDSIVTAGYIQALEDQVASLEIELTRLKQPQERHENELHDSATVPGDRRNNALDGVVELLTLGHSEAPAYVGSSAGLSMAVNLREIVQATVWNKALLGNIEGSAEVESTPSSVCDSGQDGFRGQTITINDLHTRSAGAPSEQNGSRMITAYFTRLHPRHPFLDRLEVWRLHDDRVRLTTSTNLSKSERFGIFKLYLVYAIGATLVQSTDKSANLSPESYYITALQHISAALIYHLRSASSHGLWYMIGLAMRTCIDLGLHRKLNEQNLTPRIAQLRRRLFWTVYSLERLISISLGRPVSIADRHIDIELPDEIEDVTTSNKSSYQTPTSNSVNSATSSPTPSVPSPSRSPQTVYLSQGIYLFRIRRIESHIHHSIYRTDRTLPSLLPKIGPFYSELESWKEAVHARFPPGGDLTYVMLEYNRVVRLLVQPFLPVLDTSDPYYHICLRAAGEVCQILKVLQTAPDYSHSFLAVQTAFVSGITLLYCLWTRTEEVWSVRLSNDIRACSLVLFVMSERVSWVMKYRDAFELLFSAVMEKLQGNLTGAGGIIETAARAAAAVGGHNSPANVPQTNQSFEAARDDFSSSHDFNSTSATQGSSTGQHHEEAMRVIGELANWIDQDSGVPVWMPDFDLLEKL
ncbi:hypothetical protein BP6252_13984 [Coleophoma cylindrospora]|uniref:Zn(2)-C6 fungal-type domain-containing protein n=1 Tax=Coleophoma cylindrospora TaxID=1849047 RepID=A0A3D8Q4L2_9HELO|nr:hypothetical protein BP6252_13984 [Coleophoma cylindrospora]